MSHSRWRSAAVALGLLMAVTINTIPAQAGELVRMLVTVGVGGENTANRNWWRLSSSTGSVSADSDVEIDSGLTINRILWHTSDQIRFFKSGSGSFSLAITAAGVLSGKSVLFAVNDAGDAIDAQFDIDTASISAITNRIGFNTDTAQTAAFNTVVTGGLVNIVISDPPGAVAEVFVDTAADVTAGAPDVTAAAEKEIPAPTLDTGATDVTAGAATAEASAEKVGLAQEFHETAAEVEAGAPGVEAGAEALEGGVFEETADVEAGAADVTASADKIIVPPVDTEADVEAGAPSLTADAEKVEPGAVDTAADVSVVADLEATAEAVVVPPIDTAADIEAGAPSISADAELIDVGSSDRAAAITAEAADVTVTAETRAAQLLHVRNVQNMGAVNELLTPIRHAGRMVGESGVLVTLGYNCTLRVYRGSDLDVHPCDVVAEHVRVNLGLSPREVKVGSFLTSGEKEVGIIAITLAPGGQVQYVGLGRVPDEWHRMRIEMRLPNRFGQAANYRDSMAKLRRTQRLLASSPSGQWPMPVSGWEAAS